MPVIRRIGGIQLVRGVLFWTGNAVTLLMLEVVLMVVLVLGLWGMAGLAARAGVQPGLVVLAVVWGILVPVLGIVLPRLALGEHHWVLHGMHLIGVLALAELLSGIRQRSLPAAPA